MSAPRPHIHAHTALRGVAALVVVGYHLRFGAEMLLPAEEATRLFERGYLFVDFFFLLSGFVLCYVYEPRGLPTPRAVLRFYRARIARVWPLHVLTLLVLVGFALATLLYERVTASPGSAYRAAWDALPFQLTLTHAWGMLPAARWNVPSWSISAEAFAYLLFPALLWAQRRASAAFAVLGVLAAAAFYARIAVTTGDLDITVGTALLRCLAGFVLGMALYQLRALADALPGRAVSALQLAGVAMVLLLIERVGNDVALLPPFAALVLLTASDRGLLSRLLRPRWLQRLGEWSYAIYLTHVPILIIGSFAFERVARAVGMDGEPGTRVLWILLVYAATLLVSAVTYERFEKPARAFLLRGRPAPPPSLVPAP